MPTEQLDLMGLARNSDPATSKEAAASLTPDVLNRMERIVLEALAHYPDSGANRWNVTGTVRTIPGPDLEVSSVSRRLTSLVRKGLARETGSVRPGPSGRPCAVFIITDAGRKAIEGEVTR